MPSQQNWFDTLNAALESEGFVELWPLGKNIGYDETGDIIAHGRYISVYRGSDGQYERPIHYATRAEDTI